MANMENSNMPELQFILSNVPSAGNAITINGFRSLAARLPNVFNI